MPYGEKKKMLYACSTTASQELKSRTNVLCHSPAQICTAERLAANYLAVTPWLVLYCGSYKLVVHPP